MKGSTAIADWTNSLNRQMEFYQWLQSAEGAIAGGATNSWDGAYAQPPAGTPGERRDAEQTTTGRR